MLFNHTLFRTWPSTSLLDGDRSAAGSSDVRCSETGIITSDGRSSCSDVVSVGVTVGEASEVVLLTEVALALVFPLLLLPAA